MAEEMWVLEGPQPAREGEILLASIAYSGFTAVSSGATTAYKNHVDVSTGVLTGTDTTTGNVHNLKTFTVPAGYGGSKVVLESKVDVEGGASIKCGIEFRILKPGQEM